MNRYILTLSILLATATTALSQSEGISYQAVILDNESLELPGADLVGQYLSNSSVDLRFSIEDQVSALVYQETQSTTTDAYGHIALVIGHGEQTGGYSQFEQIDWNGRPMDLLVEISYEMGEYEELGRQALHFIPYAAHRNITASGTLDVQGVSRLHSDLMVSGETEMEGQLTVDNETFLNGQTTIEGGLSVINGHPIDLSGQVTIDAGVGPGADTNVDAYALRVRGAQQGIDIKVDGGRTASKNFLTFRDELGAHGCIEGQTLTELNNSFRFIWDNVMAGLDEGFAVAEAVACGVNVPPDGAEVASNSAQAIAAYAQWVELAVYATDNVGVNFSSGGADYAEWLEKVDSTDDVQPGEVVGIFGGRISRVTEGAHELKVISTKPIVVGNRPDDDALGRYARVAFLGQAPVRVVGPVSEGDYILPSGDGDGLAKAFAPEELPTARFSEIIGIAWESGMRTDMNVINMAIGLHTGQLASRVSALELEVEQMRDEFRLLHAAMSGEDVQLSTSKTSATEEKGGPAPLAVSKVQHDLLSDEEFDAWLELHGPAFEEVMSRKRDYLVSIEADYSAYPEAVALLEEPLQALRDMRSGKFMHSLWRSLEQRVNK